MQRRRVLLCALLAVPLTAIAVACSFPDVTFTAGDGGALGDESASSSSSSSSSSGGETGPDPEMLSDGGLGDSEAGRREDDSGPIADPVEAGCDAKCDCDDDGYFRIGCTAATDADTPGVTRLGTGDCVDFDKAVRPNQTLFLDESPRPPNQGDWNCKDGIEKGYNEKPCGVLPTACGAPTFGEAVGCGVEAPWYDCVRDGLGCQKTLSAETKRRQACR